MQERVAAYVKQANHYLENAYVMLYQGDVEKASEFLWGSMAEALKGVAARKGVLLRDHREIRAFARALAAEMSDSELQSAYVRAEHLHSNFYEAFLEIEDLIGEGEVVAAAVRTLLGLAEQPVQT